MRAAAGSKQRRGGDKQKSGVIKKMKIPPSFFDILHLISIHILHPLAAGMDGQKSDADLEAQRLLIKQELKRRQRASLKARKEAEEQKLIAAGEGKLAGPVDRII